MANIYEILSKHFLGEASPEEEKTVSEFERENATEYKALKELWKRGKIEVKDFDSQQAWKQVLSVIKPEKRKHGKVVWLVTRFKRVAAVAAIIIISTFSAYYVWQNINANQELVVQNIDYQNAGEILLSDGTKVWLNKGATLKYPKRFSGNKRNIELEGEGLFEVVKNQKRPFIVKTANSQIQVLGTSFNVNAEESITTVSVISGRVKVSTKDKYRNEIITPGMTAIVTNGQVTANKTANQNFGAWKTGEFIFANTPLTQVVRDLNTYYKKPIRIDEQARISCDLTVYFSNEEIEEVLEIIMLTCSAEVEDKGDHYLIK